MAKVRGYTDGAPTASVTVIMKVMYRDKARVTLLRKIVAFPKMIIFALEDEVVGLQMDRGRKSI